MRPLASVTSGRLFVRVGARTLARAGGLAAATGALVIALFAERGPLPAGAGSFLLGVGLGLLNTTVIVAWCTPDLQIRYVNRAGRRAAGLEDRGPLVGVTVRDVVPPRDRLRAFTRGTPTTQGGFDGKAR